MGQAVFGLLTMGQLAREFSVTLRALRFYQSKGLLTPLLKGKVRLFSSEDRRRLGLIVQGKRLGFTLSEIRDLLAGGNHQDAGAALTMTRRKCIDQIALLERQRQDLDTAIAELRRIYTEMFVSTQAPEPLKARAPPPLTRT